MINVEQTIISQYGNSATITQLIRGMNDHIDPRADFDNFYSFVWNVETAQGFGLDIWGRIVDVSRALTIPGATDYFGFGEAVPGAYPFGEQPFYDGTVPETQTYILADSAYRKLILAKAMSNISVTTAQAVNAVLQNVFADRGRCYVNDLGSMRFRYTFEFLLTPYEFAIITQSGAMPRPAGVGYSLINVEAPCFGFASDAAPFGQAPFAQEGAQYVVF